MNRTSEVAPAPPTVARPFLFGAILFSLLALVGCDNAPSGVPLPNLQDGPVVASVLEESADPGQAVLVRFVNTSDLDFSFSACAREVERLVDGAWVLAAGAEAVLCLAVVDSLGAQSESTYYVSAPSGTPPGIYRFIFALATEDPLTILQVASEPFDMR